MKLSALLSLSLLSLLLATFATGCRHRDYRRGYGRGYGYHNAPPQPVYAPQRPVYVVPPPVYVAPRRY